MLREGTTLAAKVGLFLEEIAYFMEATHIVGGRNMCFVGATAGEVRIEFQISGFSSHPTMVLRLGEMRASKGPNSTEQDMERDLWWLLRMAHQPVWHSKISKK